MQWKPCLRACIKFCPIFCTFHSVWLNFRVIDVHTNILNYIPCTFGRSGSTFSRMFCQVVNFWAQPNIDGSIDWFWPHGVDRLLDSQKSDGVCQMWKTTAGAYEFLCVQTEFSMELAGPFHSVQLAWQRRVFVLHLVITHLIIADFLHETVYTSKWELISGMHIVVLGHAVAQLVEALHCTALHTGRSRVRLPMVSLGYFIDIILPAALWPWGRLSPSKKWVPGVFPGGGGGGGVKPGRWKGVTT
jgi:hypothetical protein